LTRRSAGEALDPAREPLFTLERIGATIGEMNFAAQRQQRPAPWGGGMIKAAWLQRFRLASPPPFDRIVQSWDTANSEPSDYSVCIAWGVKGPRFHLLNVLRKKLSYPELRRAVGLHERRAKLQRSRPAFRAPSAPSGRLVSASRRAGGPSAPREKIT
jgi:hypothetical protein